MLESRGEAVHCSKWLRAKAAGCLVQVGCAGIMPQGFDAAGCESPWTGFWKHGGKIIEKSIASAPVVVGVSGHARGAVSY